MTDEQHLLILLAEECSELSKACIKAARFGMENGEPGQALSNVDRIVDELTDVVAVAEMLDITYSVSKVHNKQVKVQKMMRISRKLGML